MILTQLCGQTSMWQDFPGFPTPTHLSIRIALESTFGAYTCIYYAYVLSTIQIMDATFPKKT